MSLFRRGRRNHSLGESLRTVLAELREILSLEIELRKARLVRAVRNAALVAAALLVAATLVFFAGVAVLVAIGLALAIVLPGWAAALVLSGLLGGLAVVATGAAMVAKASVRRKSTTSIVDRKSKPPRSPADVEAALADAHYRLEAEIDALTWRGNRRGARTAVTNGGSTARSWRKIARG